MLHSEKRKVNRAYSKAKVKKLDAQAWTTDNNLCNQYQEHLEIAEENYNGNRCSSLERTKHKNKAWWRTVKHFMNRNLFCSCAANFRPTH